MLKKQLIKCQPGVPVWHGQTENRMIHTHHHIEYGQGTDWQLRKLRLKLCQDVIVFLLHQSKQFWVCPTNIASSLFHVNLFSAICLLTNSLFTQIIPTRQTLLSLTLIRRNALAIAKLYISYMESASPISLQMSVWLCRTPLLQASISCENPSEEQIALYAWYWSWHLVTKDNYLQNWMDCMLSESDEMFLVPDPSQMQSTGWCNKELLQFSVLNCTS